MSDVTQGADAPDDASLFADATTTTLEKFENAEPPPPEPPKPAEPPKEPPKAEPEPPVPAGRLREEAEARRRAERERDDLLRQMAMRQPPQGAAEPAKKPDLFDNPEAFVMSLVKPVLEQQATQFQEQKEAYSRELAASQFGPEVVAHSRQALEYLIRQGDPVAKEALDRAMKSHHPYGVIASWYHERSLLHEIQTAGGNLEAYKKRVLEEAMKNPDYQRQVIEASKGGATHVARPVTSSVPKIPSLGNVGTGGGDAEPQQEHLSEEQLFRAAVTARRK